MKLSALLLLWRAHVLERLGEEPPHWDRIADSVRRALEARLEEQEQRCEETRSELEVVRKLTESLRYGG
jgi:hypothetical protein